MGYEGYIGLETIGNWMALYLSVTQGMTATTALARMGLGRELEVTPRPKMTLREYKYVREQLKQGRTFASIAREWGLHHVTLSGRYRRVEELIRQGYYKKRVIA